LFSAAREVQRDENFNLNRNICKYLFSKDPDGRHWRLGDVQRFAKRDLLGSESNKLDYLLLGDPALKLAYAEMEAKITKINGKDADSYTEMFSAGSSITISGEIKNPDGTKATDYKGLAQLTLLDAEEFLFQFPDNHVNKKGEIVYDRSKTLFTGKEFVKDGEFEFSFIMPKDMSYSEKEGLINIYAVDSTQNIEANGYFEKFIVGGTDENGIKDNTPPVILNMYLNHPNFLSGDRVNATPVFFAEVEDDTGINISGNGIGHDATIIIDNSPYLVYNINSSFDVEVGNSGKGTFKFNLPELPMGRHSLLFRVWDIMNNPVTNVIEFEVSDGLSLRIFDVYASQNPAKGFTNFHFTHDRPDSYLDMRIDVYNLNGQLVWTHMENGYSESISAIPIRWDLTTSGGQPVPPGIYVYRVTVSSEGASESSKSKKLIILR